MTQTLERARDTQGASDKERAEAIALLARNEGNCSKTGEMLGVHRSTVARWRDELRPQYEQIRRDMWEQVKEEATERHMQAASEAIRVEDEIKARLLQKLETDPDAIDARDLPGAYRNAATVAGIHTDKALQLKGDGQTDLHVHMSGPEIIEALKRKGAIEVKAEEVTVEAD